MTPQNAKSSVTAQMVLDEARTWLDTPFHHQGRLKGVGVDCIGVIIGVAHALGISDFNTVDYGRIPNGNMLRALLEQNMLSVPIWDSRPGDIGLFTFEREPQHVAIFTDTGLLHSYQQVKKCVEHSFLTPWPQRLVAVFRYQGVQPWLR